MGDANEVPHPVLVPQLFVVTERSSPAEVVQPGAIRSGLMRPSAVQPRDEKPEMLLSLSSRLRRRVEPTERPFLFVDGLRTEKSRAPPPLLPAALMMRNSRCAQMKRSMSCERAE